MENTEITVNKKPYSNEPTEGTCPQSDLCFEDKTTYLNCRIYPEEIPKLNDHVLVTFQKFTQNYGVMVLLNEYDDIEGTIYLSDLTSKRRVRSQLRLCRIGQTAVAEVIQVDPGFIGLSIKHVTEEDKKSYEEFFSLSKRLHGILRKLAYKHRIPLIKLCEEVSWPLYSNMVELDDLKEKILKHPFNLLSDRAFILGLNLPNGFADFLVEDFDSLFGAKTYTKSFTAHLISYGMDGVGDLKRILGNCLDLGKNYDSELDINLEESPKYVFKFIGPDNSSISEYEKEVTKLIEGFQTLGFYNKS